MTELDRAAAEWLAKLARYEAQAVADLLAAYRAGLPELRARLDRVRRRIEQAAKNGEPLTAAWVAEQASISSLVVAYEAHIAAVVATGGASISSAAGAAASLGAGAAAAMTPAVDVSMPGSSVLTRLISRASPDGPLRTVYDRITRGAGKELSDRITAGVIAGRSPRRIAADAAETFDAPVRQMRTVVRTEIMRAYRDAQVETYSKHPDVPQWMWVAACDARSCAACWAMHGKRFNSSTRMSGHPNCRCTMIPVVAGDDPGVVPGLDQFVAAATDTQVKVLGPAAHRAWKQGAVTLDGLTTTRRSSVWGESVGVKSLREALGADGARRFYRA